METLTRDEFLEKSREEECQRFLKKDKKNASGYKNLLDLLKCDHRLGEFPSFLFMVAFVDKLWEFKDQFYDFEKVELKPEFLESDTFMVWSTAEKFLLRLAFNCYNSYHKLDVSDAFSHLDYYNSWVAIRAIKIRYDIHDYEAASYE